MVLYSVTVTASAFWLARLTLANRLNWHLHFYTVKLHVSVIKIHVIYVYMVYLTKMANTERVSCNVYLSVAVVVSKLDVMSLSACPLLSLSLSLSPTLFIHFWTSTADCTEYLHLSAPTGSLLVFSCIITVGSFSEGHIYGTTTANRSGSGSHSSSGGGGWPWRDSTQALQKEASHVTRPSRIPPSAEITTTATSFRSLFVILFSYY